MNVMGSKVSTLSDSLVETGRKPEMSEDAKWILPILPDLKLLRTYGKEKAMR